MRRSSRHDLFDRDYPGKTVRGQALRVWLLLAGIVLCLLSVFFGGEYLQRWFAYRDARVGLAGNASVDWLDPVRDIVLNTLPEVPFLGSTRGLEESGLQIHDLRIASDELQALTATAEAVTAQVVSTGIERPYHPAEYWLNGQWIPVQVKLRGLYDSHYLARRPSFRIKFPKDRYYQGKRQINVTDPYDKGLTADVTVNWELAQHGVLTWDSDFVVLRLNGEVVGVFQEIEQFGRSMSDRNRRSEGLTFSGSGQVFGPEGSGPAWDKAQRAIALVRECTQAEPEDHCTWDFFRKYFDENYWAWAGAMKVLNQSNHGWYPDNLRLFWDPALGKFEPIPWDYNHVSVEPEKNVEAELMSSGMASTINRIPEFRRLRDARLWTLVNERVEPMVEHADALFERLREPLSYDLRHPDPALDDERHAEYRGRLRTNAAYLQSRLKRNEVVISTWSGSADGSVLEFENRAKAFAEVSAVWVDRDGHSQRIELKAPMLVDGVWRGNPGVARVRVQLPDGARITGADVKNKVTGATLVESEVVVREGAGRSPEIVAKVSPAVRQINVDGVRLEAGRAVFGPGVVRLNQSLSLPEDIEVIFSPGLDLRLGDGVSLGIYGNFTSRGTAASPIRVSGGPENSSWGAVFVQGSRANPRHAVVTHTVFQGGVGGENERTLFTAPFAVHGGVVSIYASEFLDSQAIDGVNLKYAEVDIRDVVVRGSVDDAFDCDFCEGKILTSSIQDAGGDGFDFSGSQIFVQDSAVIRCGDKGFSIGEATHAQLRGNRVEDCYTGIAVKDFSQAEIRGGELSRVEIGVSLYVKKPTFGPSLARVEDLKLKDVETNYMKDDGSSLEWKGHVGV